MSFADDERLGTAEGTLDARARRPNTSRRADRAQLVAQAAKVEETRGVEVLGSHGRGADAVALGSVLSGRVEKRLCQYV